MKKACGKTQILLGKNLVWRFPDLLLLPSKRNKIKSFAFEKLMLKSKEIRLIFLSVVYFVLLVAAVLPHHHHEEAACYTSAHCDEDVSGRDQHAEEPVDHHHDHDKPQEPRHCINLEYYVYPDAGTSIKRVFNFESPVIGHKHNFNTCLICFEEYPHMEVKYSLCMLLPVRNTFTVFVVNEIPLRGPPAFAT